MKGEDDTENWIFKVMKESFLSKGKDEFGSVWEINLSDFMPGPGEP